MFSIFSGIEKTIKILIDEITHDTFFPHRDYQIQKKEDLNFTSGMYFDF